MDSGVPQQAKNEKDLNTEAFEELEIQDGRTLEMLGTAQDQHDMWRMGKDQELRRNFRRFSIFCFTMVLMSTWEAQFT